MLPFPEGQTGEAMLFRKKGEALGKKVHSVVLVSEGLQNGGGTKKALWEA
jgi:hypothetical protein